MIFKFDLPINQYLGDPRNISGMIVDRRLTNIGLNKYILQDVYPNIEFWPKDWVFCQF